MSLFETFLVFILSALVVLPFLRSRRAQSIYWVFSPASMISLFFLVYFLVGPLSAIAFDDTFFLARDMRPLFANAWLAGVVGLMAIWAGYFSPAGKMIVGKAKKRDINADRYYKSGVLITSLGYVCVLIWVLFSGRVLDIFGAELGSTPGTEFEEVTRVSYFYHGMSLVFVGVFIQLSVKRMSLLLAAVTLIPISLMFVSIGFRYRLLFVLGGLTLILHLRSGKSPRLWILAIVATSLLVMFGIVGMARSYYGGLDFANLYGRSWSDLYLGTLGETNTFYVLGAVMDVVPTDYDFVGLQPFYYALILPIPRFMWAAKPFPEYLNLITEAIGTSAAISAGSAWPYMGEHYVAFGWSGMVIMCILLGIACRTVWLWYCKFPRDPTLMTIYCLFFPFTYYVLSRGYLAQEFQDFCFTLLPAMLARAASIVRTKTGRHTEITLLSPNARTH
ncbi:MAG: O-antigen polysaccharide polymerase Wzy [Betaproteobacteria bacterium]|nr:O-antigen polysaccharide polymerase Wzy [Betaproteobacteria bacterium]